MTLKILVYIFEGYNESYSTRKISKAFKDKQ